MVTTSETNGSARSRLVRRRYQRLYWTLGNLLLFGGLYLLLYVGGVYAEVAYQRLAARGDSDIAAPVNLLATPDAPPDLASPGAALARAAGGMSAFEAPVLSAEGQIVSAPPEAAQPGWAATVERLVLPSIKLDAKVIEVGWQLLQQGGKEVAVWQVAEYAVGQHRGSANPGEGGNIVLAGHVGGYGQVFRDLYYVHPGEQLILYSRGRQYLYTVTERLIVDEEGVSAEQRAANAQLIAPTDHEVVTMITCWPPTGPQKFTQRVVVRAVPYGPSAPEGEEIAPQSVR